MTKRPKVFLSDEPVRPADVLPPKVDLAFKGEPLQSVLANFATIDGDPETEQPYNPIPPRPEPGNQPPEEPEPDEPPDEPDPDEVDDEPEPDENEPPADEPPAETPAPPAGIAASSPASAMVAGREYSAPVTPAPIPPPTVTYRSRISVVEAWRYPGQLAEAPDFIDRSWTAWADGDLYGGSSGPALRVPVARSISGPVPNDGFKLCRIGDYVVRQMVTLVDGLEPEESVDVWPKDSFERLFMPCSNRAKSKHGANRPDRKNHPPLDSAA